MANEDQNFSVKKYLLGEILLKRSIVTQPQLNQALEVQKNQPGYLGEILIKLGFAQEQDILVALVVQCNFPYIAVDKYEIDRSVISLVSKEQAIRLQVIPLDRVGEVLSVVMANPLDAACRAELQRLTNFSIAPFIATRGEISRAIERWYGK